MDTKIGLEIAATKKIERNGSGWLVPSQSSDRVYKVRLDTESCDCPDHQTRQVRCKHIIAAQIVVTRETNSKGETTITKTVRVTYRQDWPSYNTAQVHEQERFVELLRDLCAGIAQPPSAGTGRPQLLLSDVMFSLVYKVYSTMSGRRFSSDLRNALDNGLITKAPSYNSAFRYLEKPEITPLLKTLIEESANPLKAVEADFAVDSSGFSTSVYDRWFDHKWGKVRSEKKWVKIHMMCGVTTNVITAVEVTPTETADAPRFAPLVANTAQRFAIREVSADKAYSSRRNLQIVEAVGGIAYIPFKSRTNGIGNNFDSLWNVAVLYVQSRGFFGAVS